AASDRPALYVYVHDERAENGRPLGGAAKWRLAQSLSRFEGALASRGARLDATVRAELKARGVEAQSFNGRLMREPGEVAKADGGPSGSFSAFWRRCRGLGPLPETHPPPRRL